MLNKVRHHVNLFRRYKYWQRSQCIYIHIPKVAGTSINNALYGRTLGHYTANEIRNFFPKLYAKTFSFAFVRNPYDRVASAYRFAKMGKTESMGIYRASQYESPDFESFERFVLDWLPKQNLQNIDFVFQPQYKFVTDDAGEVIIDFIGKLESLQSDIKLVESRLDRALNIREMNKSSRSSECLALPDTRYKNKDMIEAVSSVYAHDFKMFGYEFYG